MELPDTQTNPFTTSDAGGDLDVAALMAQIREIVHRRMTAEGERERAGLPDLLAAGGSDPAAAQAAFNYSVAQALVAMAGHLQDLHRNVAMLQARLDEQHSMGRFPGSPRSQ